MIKYSKNTKNRRINFLFFVFCHNTYTHIHTAGFSITEVGMGGTPRSMNFS